MSGLRTIVYTSHATRPFRVTDLEGLLTDARARNRERGVTGVLLYGDGSFMQCLEGPAPAVADTYRLIRSSRSHGGVIELLDMAIDERSFADWQMGLAIANPSELLELATAQCWADRNLAVASARRSRGLVLLRSFWERVRR